MIRHNTTESDGENYTNQPSTVAAATHAPAPSGKLGLVAGICLVGAVNMAMAQGELLNGGNHDGLISPVGDSDTWTFVANAGDNIVLQAGELVSGSSYAPRIELYGPDASLITAGGNPAAVRIAVQATNSGTFTAVVRDNGDINTGGYRLYFARMPGSFVVADDGGALTNGGNYDGTIDLADLDLWSFDAQAGDNVILRVGELTSTGTFAPRVELYGPAGQLVDFDFGNLAAGVLVGITNGGIHTVLVRDHAVIATGTYRLYFAKLPGSFLVGDNGGALTNGGSHDGTIELGDLDLWSFRASAGDSIVARIGLLTVTNLFGSFFWLFDPDGQLVETASSAARAGGLAYRATNSGTFTIVVIDSNADQEGTGDYRLHLAKIPGPYIVADEGGWLTNGISVSGSNHLGDLDLWTFWASAGNAITARVDKITGGTPYRPFVQLYSPTGIPLQSDSDANTAQVIHAATNSGAFRAIVRDVNAATNGTYTLLVSGATPPPALPPPVLNIANAAPGFVTLWWPSNYLGFVLEETPQLDEVNWGEMGVTKTNVGTNTTATVPVEAGNQFFRLSGP